MLFRGRGDGICALGGRAPVNSPPGCSVCAKLQCIQTYSAQTARSRSRLHPQIPSVFIKKRKRAPIKSRLSFPWSRRRDLNPRPHGPEPCALPTALRLEITIFSFELFSVVGYTHGLARRKVFPPCSVTVRTGRMSSLISAAKTMGVHCFENCGLSRKAQGVFALLGHRSDGTDVLTHLGRQNNGCPLF